jgi:hypothetical protein
MRDPNGRFAKANNHLESESVSVFDCEPLKRVIDAWNAQRFEFKLARAGRSPRVFMRTHHPNRSASFTRISNPTPLNLSTPIKQGASEATLLGMASRFHFRCVESPHLAPPAPSPMTEVERSQPECVMGTLHTWPIRAWRWKASPKSSAGPVRPYQRGIAGQ